MVLRRAIVTCLIESNVFYDRILISVKMQGDQLELCFSVVVVVVLYVAYN